MEWIKLSVDQIKYLIRLSMGQIKVVTESD